MRTHAPLFLLSALALGCSSTPDGDSSAQDATESPLSYVGQRVLDALQAKHPAMQGKTWDFSADNALDQGWVLQTPAVDYWGQPGASLPVATPCDADEAAC